VSEKGGAGRRRLKRDQEEGHLIGQSQAIGNGAGVSKTDSLEKNRDYEWTSKISRTSADVEETEGRRGGPN